MKVKKVSANVRFSSAVRYGKYKTVELSAEATVDPKESWEAAQAELYDRLGKQLKALWASGASGGGEDSYAQEAA